MSVFSAALAIALEFGHNYIGTEHLLLALSRSAGIAASVLRDAGLTHEDLRSRVEQGLSAVAVSKPPSPAKPTPKPASKSAPAKRKGANRPRR